jgi:hypothetical protein
MLLNSEFHRNLWCYAAETAADVYHYTYHSALDMTPYEAWYGIKPHVNNLHVKGCYIYVHVQDPKKLDNRVIHGHFLGFTKSCLIVRNLDPATSSVKHTSAVLFDEYNTRLYDHDTLSPGALLLSGCDPPDLASFETINIIDFPHLDTPPFIIQLAVPPKRAFIGCEITTDTYHNLPYISIFVAGTTLATSLLLHGRYNSCFWIIGLNSHEFITAKAVVDYLRILQLDTGTNYVPCILARRIASNRTNLTRKRILFNQIHLINEPTATPPTVPSPTTIAPVGCKVISSPIHLETPKHFGQTLNMPFASDWHDALLQNYTKMRNTGTFSAPML